jgi:hypothetical protein
MADLAEKEKNVGEPVLDKKVEDTISKYKIGWHLSDLTEEAKVGIFEAIKAAEQRVTAQTVLSHWKEIFLVILIISVVIMNYRMRSAQTELEVKNETYNRLQKIDAIDSTLKSVQDNQKNLYPQMDATVQGLENARAQLKTLNTKISTITQSQSREAASKLGIEELSKELTVLGYPNKIVREVPPK